MKTAFDLALLALADLFIRANERRAASDPEQKQDHEPDAEEDVEHGGSVVEFGQQVVDDHRAYNRDGNGDAEQGDEFSHGLDLGFLLGALGGSKLGPDFLPVSRTQFLEARTSVDPVQPARELRGCRLQTVEDLVEVLLVDTKHFCDLMPAFRGVVWKCHASLSSRSIEYVK